MGGGTGWLEGAFALALWVAAALLAALFADLARARRAAASEGRGSRALAAGLELAVWLGAALALARLLASSHDDFLAAATDGDTLIFAALAGGTLAGLPVAWRVAAVAGLSLLVAGFLAGPGALACNLAALLPCYAVARWVTPRSARLSAALQVALLAGLGLALARLRLVDGLAALYAYALYSFVGMRHLSFMAAAREGPPASLAQYLAYLFFFPNCVGSMEVFREFRERNLDGPSQRATPEAIGRIALGALVFVVSQQFDASLDRVLAAPGPLAAWAEVLRLFVRSSLGVTGIWGMVDGGALLLGFRLRPNFRGILLAENPSAFWHAWRGTMTHWLTFHVYVPLGGRDHRIRNAAGVFAVSTAWHCAGAAMLRGDRFAPAVLVPIVAWGSISFAGVALHMLARAYRPVPSRPPLAAAAVRATKIAGTWVYGSFTVTLLDLSMADPERLARFVRLILGL